MSKVIIKEIECPPNLTRVKAEDGFILTAYMLNESRLRSFIYDMLKNARDKLPPKYKFCVYETYRTHQNQIMEWDKVCTEMRANYPDLDIDSTEFIAMCEEFVANPYTHGSGHQTGAAIDLTICDADTGIELDMGTPMNSCVPMSRTYADGLSGEQQQNRNLLVNTMQSVGFINYPSEWWHYSFGDRLWAELTGNQIAIFSKLPL